MPKTRPDGSPFTPDDFQYWNQLYTFQEFPKMVYRRRSGLARALATKTLQLEGTTTTPAGIVLHYLTVQSAVEETQAATAGCTELAAAIASIPTTTKSRP